MRKGVVKMNTMDQDESNENGPDEESSSESEDGEPHPNAYTGNEEIQVDFEGRNPIDSDFHGIRQLLQQLFLKAHINLSELTDIIITQNYVGSVVIQSECDEEEDDDDDMYDTNMIFGITTVINITNKQNLGCVQEFSAFLLQRAEKNATDAVLAHFRDVLSNTSRPVGFLINERFINIPAQISVPLLESLQKEIKRACEKKMPYEFEYFIVIIKFHRKEAKKKRPEEDIYINQEEELFSKKAVSSFQYSVKGEADEGMTGDWLEGDKSLTPYRKVALFDASSFADIVYSIKEFVNQ